MCWPCQGMGYRGMDRCNLCDTTGSVFRVDGKSYPNTKSGYEAALAALKNYDAQWADNLK